MVPDKRLVQKELRDNGSCFEMALLLQKLRGLCTFRRSKMMLQNGSL